MKISLCKPKLGPDKHIILAGEMVTCREYYVLSVHDVEIDEGTYKRPQGSVCEFFGKDEQCQINDYEEKNGMV